jgi:hypothetical protein
MVVEEVKEIVVVVVFDRAMIYPLTFTTLTTFLT